MFVCVWSFLSLTLWSLNCNEVYIFLYFLEVFIFFKLELTHYWILFCQRSHCFNPSFSYFPLFTIVIKYANMFTVFIIWWGYTLQMWMSFREKYWMMSMENTFLRVYACTLYTFSKILLLFLCLDFGYHI